MATQSPFHLLESLAQALVTNFPPPPWAVTEVQRRIVLLLNHVLMQEKAAMTRLMRQKGRVVHVQWQQFSLRLLVTPAGLLDLAPEGTAADLGLTATDGSAADIAHALLRGDKPSIRIEGDVQLAAEVNWLVDHLRWDIEEDLSRIVGDAPAHAVGQFGRGLAGALRQFLASAPRPKDAGGAAP